MSKVEDRYWSVAPRGIDACLTCTREICYYDEGMNDSRVCPFVKASPPIHTQRADVLKIVKNELQDGPVPASELNKRLKEQHGIGRNILYDAIADGFMEVERIPVNGINPYGNQRVKIVVLGVK